MSEQLSRAVAAEVRRLLEERGMSGRALARATGIDQGSISRKLKGETSLDLDDVQAIAAALDVRAVDLLTWAER